MDTITLRDLLVALTTTGAAVLAYYIMAHIPGLSTLPPEPKRWVAFALTGALALAGWGLQIVMLYVAQPADWRAWVADAVAIAGAAIVQGQLIHGAKDLRGRTA